MQYFSLNTNVKQLRIGKGVSKGIGKRSSTLMRRHLVDMFKSSAAR